MKRWSNWLAAAALAAGLFTQSLGLAAHAAAPGPAESLRYSPTLSPNGAAPTDQAAASAPAATLRGWPWLSPPPWAEPSPAPAADAASAPSEASAPPATEAAAPAATPAPTATPTPQAPQPKGKLIFIDPGHGAQDTGAVHYTNGQLDLTEKDANLSITLKLADLLRQDGYDVQMSRSDDTTPAPVTDVAADLQARVDLANQAGADLFIAVHNNGSNNASLRGTEVYYCSDREFGADSARLAKLVDEGVVRNLRQAGYDTADRGAKDDSIAGHYAVLAPSNIPRATNMPGILGESLFVSSDQDAAQLQRPEIRDAIARGYFEGIQAYFGNPR